MYLNIRSILYELVVPVFIMCFGVSLTSIDFFTRSETRILDHTRIANETQIMLVDKDITLGGEFTGEDFARNMNLNGQYDMHITNTSFAYLNDFVDYTYYFGRGNKPDFPYLYASYKFYEADRASDSYKFYTMVNFTARESVSLYPQFMYEAVLRTALDEPEFELKTRSTPYPITNVVRERKV